MTLLIFLYVDGLFHLGLPSANNSLMGIMKFIFLNNSFQNTGWGPRRIVDMSRPSQTESAYVQTVPDGKWSAYVQTFVRSPDFRAFMSRLSCVHQTFARSTDFRAFTRLSCVHVQIFVRSYPDFRALTRLSCVHENFVSSSDFRAFMSGLPCVHPNWIKLGLEYPLCR